MSKLSWRFHEALLLLIVYLVAGIGFISVTVAGQVRQGLDPAPALMAIAAPLAVVVLVFTTLNVILSLRRVVIEQTILPITALLVVIGLVMIWRLRGVDGIYQQALRGLLPGTVLAAALLLWRPLIERIRRWAVYIGLGGLLLLLLTGLFGVQDETGARLALRLGPLPSVQTTELIKLALIIFLAWYIDREGRAAEGRARTLLWFRLPGLHYLAPAVAFVGAATLALVAMSDYGAVLILGVLFIAMLYIGFETRIFATISALGLGLALLVGFVLSQTWDVPDTILYRFLAFRNPWSVQLMPNGLTIAEGPGYQIQQAIYAVIAGGVTGTGLGLGSPSFVPLAHSDFILAAIVEEMGLAVGVAVLGLYAVVILRIFRLVLQLPRAQVFERLLVAGIGVHFFAQAFIMAGGTFNMFPLTGVTLPFLSQGGMALLVNLIEVGMVLAIAQRVQDLGGLELQEGHYP